MNEFAAYFSAEKVGAKAPELKEIFEGLKAKYPGIEDAKTKAAMETALRTFEDSNTDLCELIPSEDQFYGVSRGANKLENYIQWVYVPAVKDATAERQESKNTAFGKLLERRVHSQTSFDEPIQALRESAVKEYEQILEQNSAALRTLSDSLNARFKQWSHQNAGVQLDWTKDEKAIEIGKPRASVKATEGFMNLDLARFGHGLQRSFIFALLQELAEHDQTQGAKLILGVEEPELYQHPPQARYLASVFRRLSEQNSQVLLCTHSPFFVSGRDFQNIRVIRKDPQDNCSNVRQTTFDDVAGLIATATGEPPIQSGGLMAKVEQEMQGQLNEMFFAAIRVFVEGLEDQAYIHTYLTLMDKIDEFRSLGGHIIQVQGKNHLIQAVAISKALELPYFTVFDCDGDEKKEDRRKKHEKDNLAILKLHDLVDPQPFPDETFWHKNSVAWKTKIGDIAREEIGIDNWARLSDKVRSDHKIFVSDMGKNGLFLGYLLGYAWEEGLQSHTLIKLCEEILVYAKSLSGRDVFQGLPS